MTKEKEIIELKKEIKELIKQKQDIISKEGYPATDIIAVLRKEIQQSERQRIIDLIKEQRIYLTKIGKFKLGTIDREELLQKISSSEGGK